LGDSEPDRRQHVTPDTQVQEMSLRGTLMNWLSNNYVLSRLYHRIRLDREGAKRGDIIIVFQMGKVGSTSIVHALRERLPDSPVFHVHFLTESGIEDAKTRLGQLMKRYNANAWCLYESDFVRRYLERHGSSRRIRIITLFREPIARNISSFFYNITKYVPDKQDCASADVASIERIQDSYLRVFDEHEFPLNWFDTELSSVFGVSVLDNFDVDKGYAIIDGEQVDVLALKLEKLKQCATTAFQQFLGIENLNLDVSNASDEQPYYNCYKRFLREVRLPGHYLDKMYRSRYMLNLYSEDEIREYRQRWS